MHQIPGRDALRISQGDRLSEVNPEHSFYTPRVFQPRYIHRLYLILRNPVLSCLSSTSCGFRHRPTSSSRNDGLVGGDLPACIHSPRYSGIHPHPNIGTAPGRKTPTRMHETRYRGVIRSHQADSGIECHDQDAWPFPTGTNKQASAGADSNPIPDFGWQRDFETQHGRNPERDSARDGDTTRRRKQDGTKHGKTRLDACLAILLGRRLKSSAHRWTSTNTPT